MGAVGGCNLTRLAVAAKKGISNVLEIKLKGKDVPGEVWDEYVPRAQHAVLLELRNDLVPEGVVLRIAVKEEKNYSKEMPRSTAGQSLGQVHALWTTHRSRSAAEADGGVRRQRWIRQQSQLPERRTPFSSARKSRGTWRRRKEPCPARALRQHRAGRLRFVLLSRGFMFYHDKPRRPEKRINCPDRSRTKGPKAEVCSGSLPAKLLNPLRPTATANRFPRSGCTPL